MGEQISKKDANPIVVLILNLIMGGIGYLIIGQKKKGIAAIIIFFILLVCCWIIGICLIVTIPFSWLIGIGGAMIWSLICGIDGFKIATKLKAGESLDICHCEIAFLAKLPGFHE
jgi:FtsH-binding integral membrane protein